MTYKRDLRVFSGDRHIIGKFYGRLGIRTAELAVCRGVCRGRNILRLRANVKYQYR